MQSFAHHTRSACIAVAAIACLSGLAVSSAYAQFSIIAEFPQQLIRPTSGLVEGPNLVNANVRLYGVSEFGGTAGAGVLFMYEPSTNTVTQIADFGRDFGTVGAPAASSARIGSGEHRLAVVGNTIYGVAREGGASGYGCIWRWAPTGGTPSPRPELLGSFDLSGNGGYPSDGLVSDGTSLYGVCPSGGNNGVGTIWKMAASGGTISVLHHFQKRDVDTVIGEPIGGLAISGSDLVGCARRVTSTSAVSDVLYSVPTSGGSISVSHPFNSVFATGDGYPGGTLISGGGGLIYGVLYEKHQDFSGQARLFRFSGALEKQALPGSGHERISLSFVGSALHVVTESGTGEASQGAVYRWSPGSPVTTLGNMSTSAGGVSRPSGLVYRDSGGNIFGTCEGPSYGSVWKLPSGASPSVTAVSTFVVPEVGGRPNGIVASSNGDIFGYEAIGQSIWRYNPAAAAQGLQRVDFFTAASGMPATGNLLADGSGQVIGLSSDGAANGWGGSWTWTQHGGVKSRFSFPVNEETTGGMVMDAAGVTFGTSNNFSSAGVTAGPLTTLWKLSGTTRTVAATFSKATHGSYAYGPLAIGTDGAVYGICLMGGTEDGGTLWKWTQAGGLVELFPFEFSTNFQRPHGGLIVRADGSLYGTCGPVTSEAARVWRFTPGDATPMVRHGSIAKATQGQYFETVTGFENLAQRQIVAVLAPVVERSGVLYGVTDFGSSGACGSLWTISLGGTSPLTVNTAHNFRRSTASEGRADGGRGLFSLAVGADSRVYGVGDDALWAYGAAGVRPPSVVTNPSSSPFATKLTLNGAVNPHGASTTVSFEYGTSADALTETVVAAQSPLAGSTTTAVTAEAKFLEPNKSVFFRVKAVNANGTSYGAIAKGETVAATGTLPVVTTLPASGITHESATLSGKVSVMNPVQTADNAFVWGVSKSALNNRIVATPPTASGPTEVPFSVVLSGLAPHTVYFFQARSATILGMGKGKGEISFKTLNRNPVANDETFFARPSSPITLPILSNDTDADTDIVSIKSFAPLLPAQGKLTKVGSTLLFTPAATFTGTTFTYVAQDAFGGVSNSATVTLSLDTLAIDPTANPGALAALTMSYPVTIDVGQPATPWNVIETSPFVSVTPMSGSGDGTVTVTVATNTTKTARTATVLIGGVTHSINQPGVVVPAFAPAASPPPAVVGGVYTYAFSTTTAPLPAPVFVASNLPKGLKVIVNSDTGAPTLEGRPDKAGSYDVVIKASNAATTAATAPALPITIVVRELPPELVGVHTALVDANVETGLPGGPTNFNRQVGAHVNFTTTALGTFSGTVRLGKGTKAPDTLPFKGRINAVAAASPAPITGTATVNVLRKAPLAPLVLTLNFDSAQANLISGTLGAADDALSVAAFTGWRNKWTVAAPATVLKDAKNKPLKEYYTMSLSPPSSAATAVPAEPLGWGYLTFTLQPVGTLAWGGALADGTVVTGASILSPTNQWVTFAPLYQRTAPAPTVNLGVLSGLPQVTRPANTVAGTLKWKKEAQVAPGVAPLYTYMNAYSHDLVAEGALYTPPPAIIFGLTYAAGNTNAVLDFENGGLAAPHLTTIDQTFAINTSNAAIFNAGISNPNLVKLTINKTLGLFNGTFTLVDGTIKRSNIAYRGVIRPDTVTQANGRGKGHFVLPQLPATGTSTLDTPRLSGSVELRPQ